MLQAKQLTEKSWMIRDTKLEKSVGMVNLRDNLFYLLGVKEPFESLDAVATHLGGQLAASEQEIKEELITEINGFPIKHRTACSVETKEINGIKIETYKTSESSRKIYAAGYFGLIFKNGLGCGIGVLYQTLLDNGFIGPYKTEIDLEFSAKQYSNRNISELKEE